MKKYCFTQCFKRKMSNAWELAIQVAIGILVAAGLVLTTVLAGGLVGWAWLSALGYELENVVEAGLSVIVIGGVIGIASYWMAILGARITTSTAGFVKKRYEGEPFQCSIFEECKEEENEDA